MKPERERGKENQSIMREGKAEGTVTDTKKRGSQTITKNNRFLTLTWLLVKLSVDVLLYENRNCWGQRMSLNGEVTVRTRDSICLC